MSAPKARATSDRDSGAIPGADSDADYGASADDDPERRNGFGNGAAPDATASSADAVQQTARLLQDLSRRTEQAPASWRDHIFDAISGWLLPTESVSDGDEHVYFIAGEAFNWRRLAERLAWHIELLLPDDVADDLRRWVEDDDIFGGVEESEFRRILGSDKWRAYLNYFYGVMLERCLLVYAGNRIGKQEFSRGRQVSDDQLDDAYVALYDASEPDLWARYLAETDPTPDDERRADDARSTAQDDAFTYWLFKRRIAATHQVHVAHEVKHGLELFDKVGDADQRRRRMLARDDVSAWLEFKLAKRSVRRPSRKRSRAANPVTGRA